MTAARVDGSSGRGRDAGAQAPDDASRLGSGAFAPPLYPKLPPGPHTIPSDEIEAIQRERLRGAVIHAVASGGYQATSTRELCRLAGVSKRTLYERFGSKEACLQATYDAVLEPIVTAMRQALGSQREPRVRLRVVIDAFHTAVVRERCGATLGLIITAEAAESALGGPMRLVDHLGELLGACYADGNGPPDFVLRGAGTAVMSVTRSWIFHGREDELGELARQLSDWLHRYRGKDTRLLGQGRSELLMEAAQERDTLGVDGAQALDDPPTLRQSSQRALSLMGASGASDHDWAVGTCLAYFELLCHVRSDPGSARLAFVDAPGLGPDADGVREQMIQGGVDLYSRRVPVTRTPSPAVGHAVTGASWGLMHDHLEGRDGDLRTSVLCEQMSYLAIAPVLGSKRAVRSILSCRSATTRRQPKPPPVAVGA
jgi:AcrR family transcriptional regulator